MRLNGSSACHGSSRFFGGYTIGSSEARFLGRAERSPGLL